MERIGGQRGGMPSGRPEAPKSVVEIIGGDSRGVQHLGAIDRLGQAGHRCANRGAPLRVTGGPLDAPFRRYLDRNPHEVAAGRTAGGTGGGTFACITSPGSVSKVVLYGIQLS